MTIIEAWKTVLEQPIKNLPNIVICRNPESSFYIGVDEDGELTLHNWGTREDSFYMTTEELVADNWVVNVKAES
jgi:hypothetical protein